MGSFKKFLKKVEKYTKQYAPLAIGVASSILPIPGAKMIGGIGGAALSNRKKRKKAKKLARRRRKRPIPVFLTNPEDIFVPGYDSEYYSTPMLDSDTESYGVNWGNINANPDKWIWDEAGISAPLNNASILPFRMAGDALSKVYVWEGSQKKYIPSSWVRAAFDKLKPKGIQLPIRPASSVSTREAVSYPLTQRQQQYQQANPIPTNMVLSPQVGVKGFESDPFSDVFSDDFSNSELSTLGSVDNDDISWV